MLAFFFAELTFPKVKGCTLGRETEQIAGDVKAEDEEQHWPSAFCNLHQILPFNNCRESRSPYLVCELLYKHSVHELRLHWHD